ncbi:hypothetical protein [Nocardioides soli]|uniref:Uncharacterized protein n=1 Tax=Nocardioides soli TaxID=1036020 RepID=A0A7W4Z4G7_9ACTN|nr:hypothetical protein [Nocardioides soli]MBB3044896.1 hypothetical protein [Nocardioides soli]
MTDDYDTHALLIENVALKHKLPDELADALKGDTREELDAHAAVLAKFAPQSDEDAYEDDPPLEGGGMRQPTWDPLAEARAARARRRW